MFKTLYCVVDLIRIWFLNLKNGVDGRLLDVRSHFSLNTLAPLANDTYSSEWSGYYVAKSIHDMSVTKLQ